MKFSAHPKQIFSHPVHFLAFGLGSGLSPIAPGTLGTLVAIPLYLLLSGLTLISYLSLVGGFILASIYIAGRSAQLLGVHDHPGIVIDEVCGYLITMCLAPTDWQWIACGFILFRLFDIFKPWPIKSMDKNIAGGLGIVVDDLMAAIYSLISLQIIIWITV